MKKSTRYSLLGGATLLAGGLAIGWLLYRNREKVRATGRKLQRAGHVLLRAGKAAETTGRRLKRLEKR